MVTLNCDRGHGKTNLGKLTEMRLHINDTYFAFLRYLNRLSATYKISVSGLGMEMLCFAALDKITLENLLIREYNGLSYPRERGGEQPWQKSGPI